jgi:chromosome partitioning protein
MNVITLASRKGGVGKSTLTAHLAGYANLLGYRSMVVDADPQGSLTLWHSMRARGMRGTDGLGLQNAAQGINRILGSAQLNGCSWVFIDTAPTTWLVVQEAIRAATLLLIRCARASSTSPPCARRLRPPASSASPMRW